jgi:hypothetical protein
MAKSLALMFLLLLAVACSQKTFVVEDNYSGTPAPPAPDYSRPEHWASLPDKKDAADSIPLETTLEDLQSVATADVFFVHPTTFTGKPNNSYRWNADVNDKELNHKTQVTTILNQASIFNGSCRVYAPYYRQAHLYAFYTPDNSAREAALNLAYQDVKTAFEYYLAHDNQGRPIVIASHSQGSYHCERLLKDYFDGKDLRKQLVMAYVIGRGIRPDAFATIRPTEQPDETGVWASWNTFARDFYPDNYERYFKYSLSTNPLLWNSSENFAPKELNHGAVGLHFTHVPQLVDAQNHQGLLWINKPYIKGRAFIRTKRWHRADMNFFYMNIRENVALRIEKYLGKSQVSVPTGNH